MMMTTRWVIFLSLLEGIFGARVLPSAPSVRTVIRGGALVWRRAFRLKGGLLFLVRDVPSQGRSMLVTGQVDLPQNPSAKL